MEGFERNPDVSSIDNCVASLEHYSRCQTRFSAPHTENQKRALYAVICWATQLASASIAMNQLLRIRFPMLGAMIAKSSVPLTVAGTKYRKTNGDHASVLWLLRTKPHPQH